MVETLAAGAIGGLLGAGVMGALMRTVMRENPLPSEVFAAQFVFDGDPLDHRYWGLGIHLLYGTALGAVFAWLVGAFGPGLSGLTGAFAVAYGMGWGLVLWVISFAWLEVLGTLDRIAEMPADERVAEIFLILFGHLVYGAVLGYVARATLAL